jgi:flagellar motor switch protein FliM
MGSESDESPQKELNKEISEEISGVRVNLKISGVRVNLKLSAILLNKWGQSKLKIVSYTL